MAESEEELKSLLMRVKEESEKAGLKLNIQKKKIMASNPITSWQTEGEEVETVTDFIFLGSKITVPGDCSHEIKRCLLLGRKAMTNLDSILKSRDITLLTKVCTIKAIVSPGVMYGCENWTLRKAESWRIDAFELCHWRRLLRGPWTARRSNQPILKEINPGNLLEGLMQKLKLQYLGHLMWRADSMENTLILGQKGEEGEEGDRGWDAWMASRSQGHEFEWTPGDSEGQESLACCSPWGCRVWHDWMTEQRTKYFLARQKLDEDEKLSINCIHFILTVMLSSSLLSSCHLFHDSCLEIAIWPCILSASSCFGT